MFIVKYKESVVTHKKNNDICVCPKVVDERLIPVDAIDLVSMHVQSNLLMQSPLLSSHLY
jgi:hypothetical protein